MATKQEPAEKLSVRSGACGFAARTADVAAVIASVEKWSVASRYWHCKRQTGAVAIEESLQTRAVLRDGGGFIVARGSEALPASLDGWVAVVAAPGERVRVIDGPESGRSGTVVELLLPDPEATARYVVALTPPEWEHLSASYQLESLTETFEVTSEISWCCDGTSVALVTCTSDQIERDLTVTCRDVLRDVMYGSSRLVQDATAAAATAAAVFCASPKDDALEALSSAASSVADSLGPDSDICFLCQAEPKATSRASPIGRASLVLSSNERLASCLSSADLVRLLAAVEVLDVVVRPEEADAVRSRLCDDFEAEMATVADSANSAGGVEPHTRESAVSAVHAWILNRASSYAKEPPLNETKCEIAHRIGVARARRSGTGGAESESAVEMQLFGVRGLTDLLGENHPKTLRAVADLADLRQARGELGMALSMHRRVVAGHQAGLSPNSLDAMRAAAGLAGVCMSMELFDEADRLFRRAMDGFVAKLGSDHEETLMILGNLGVLRERTGKLTEAKSLLSAALRGKEANLGKTHPETLRTAANLAMVLERENSINEAVTLLQQVKQGFEEKLGAMHSETLQAAEALGKVLVKAGDLTGAETLMRSSWEGFRAALGPQHFATLNCQSQLGFVLMQQERLTEAAPMYREVYEVRLSTDGPAAPGTMKAGMDLAMLLMQLSTEKSLSEARQLLMGATSLEIKNPTGRLQLLEQLLSHVDTTLQEVRAGGESGE